MNTNSTSNASNTNIRVQKSLLGFDLFQVSRRIVWKNTTQGTFALPSVDKLTHFKLSRVGSDIVIKGEYKGQNKSF